MSRCFISYHHVKPDEDLARKLETFLTKHNHYVFIDTRILVGDKWDEVIERELNAADFFIVFLSGKSIGSDMVDYEVELAYELYKQPGRQFTILPIRVDHKEKLPYRLAAKLNRIQHTVWTPGISFDTVAGQILTAIQKNHSRPIDGNATGKQPPAKVSLVKEAKPTEPETIPKPKWADILGIDQYGTFADFSIKGVVQRMRLILPGQFKMGSPANEMQRYDNEKSHEVLLTESFWLADTTCTQALWQAVMGDNPSGFKGPQRPVELVSWEDCQSFIQKMKQLKPGLELCLPSEAQWEYACRAGTQTPFSFGDNITPGQVNYNGNSPYAEGKKGKNREETVDVKSLPCNKWGLYQMHGNVWEWCADWYGDYSADPIVNPTGPDNGEGRVFRGGCWDDFGRYARSAYRFRYQPSYRNDNTGLRISSGHFEHRQ